MSTPDFDKTQADADQMFDFLDEDAANNPARQKRRRSQKELVMPIIRTPVPISESGAARVGEVPDANALDDDFEFLGDNQATPKSNSSRLGEGWNEGIRADDADRTISPLKNLVLLGAGAVVLGAAAVAYIYLKPEPAVGIAGSSAPTTDAVNASENDTTTLTENGALIGGSVDKPLSQRFFEKLREVEAQVAAGQLDTAEQTLTSMDRSVYGYGAPEFAAIEQQISDIRNGVAGSEQAVETVAQARDTVEATRALQVEQAAQLEAARIIEAASLEEAARAAEAARLAEAELIAEAARLEEVARLAEVERVAETARLAELARVAQLARQAEAERVAEVARRAEADRVAAAARAVEAERAAEALRADAAEALAQAKTEQAAQAARETARLAQIEAQRLAEQQARIAAAAAAERAEQVAAAAVAAQEKKAVEESLALATAKAEQRLIDDRAAKLATDRRFAERERLNQERADAAEFARQQAQLAEQRRVEQQRQSALEAQEQLQITSNQTDYSVTDDDFNFVGGKFVELKSAIENRDIATVIALTQKSGTRVQQMLQIFQNNASIEARIANVASRNIEGVIVGQLRIQKLVKSSGAVVDAPSNLSSITLTSKRGPAGWSTIAW